MAVLILFGGCQTGDSYLSAEISTQANQRRTSRTAISPFGLLSDMVYVQGANHSFYIDRFEISELAPGDFFSVPNQKPVIDITVRKARNICQIYGKRLCTKSEWTNACLGIHRRKYSYGNAYLKERCNINSGQTVTTGKKEECQSDSGIHDMVGNAMEWVADNHNGKGMALGGSFNSGAGSDCFTSFYFPSDFKSRHIGFRCCY